MPTGLGRCRQTDIRVTYWHKQGPRLALGRELLGGLGQESWPRGSVRGGPRTAGVDRRAGRRDEPMGLRLGESPSDRYALGALLFLSSAVALGRRRRCTLSSPCWATTSCRSLASLLSPRSRFPSLGRRRHRKRSAGDHTPGSALLNPTDIISLAALCAASPHFRLLLLPLPPLSRDAHRFWDSLGHFFRPGCLGGLVLFHFCTAAV